MNTIKAEIYHKYFKATRFEPFTVSIENCTVKIVRADILGNVVFSISGRKSCEKLRILFFELFELLFIYLGHYPEVVSLKRNNENENLKDLLNKYESSTLFGKLLPVCDINENSVNEAALSNLRNLRKNPLFSLEYLLSKGYDTINITHRLLLLLHAMDGFVTQAQRASIEQDLKRITGSKGKEKAYKKAVFFICQDSFFGYHKKYNCEILSELQLTRKSFLDKVTDTRNVYSHFYTPVKPESPIEAGNEIAYFFELLFFVTRVFLCKQIGVDLREQNIKESFYRIHDWIIQNKTHKNKRYKSFAYALAAMND